MHILVGLGLFALGGAIGVLTMGIIAGGSDPCEDCPHKPRLNGKSTASEEYSEEIFPGLDNLPLRESMRQKHYVPGKKKFK